MAVYIITGKLGAGKTLVAVGLIRDALIKGRKVATNIDLWPENMLSWQNKSATIYRLPDKLQAASFETIGTGNDFVTEIRGHKIYDEEKNGLIVLDEGGLSMNSRDFRESGRKEFIQWCIHSRKKGWDVAIIIQHFDSLDKQIRDMFGEHVVYSMRFDRMRIPLIGGLLQFLGFKGKMAGAHMALCKYGSASDAPISWRKVFQGRDLWFAYDTRQQFFPSDDEAVYSVLPPYYVKGRYSEPWAELKDFLRNLYDDYLGRKVGRLFVFFCAMGIGIYAHASFSAPSGDQQSAGVKTYMGASETSANESTKIEVENNNEVTDDAYKPWDYAYLSTHVKLSEKEYSTVIRGGLGERLELPKGAPLVHFGPCNASTKIDDVIVKLECRKKVFKDPDADADQWPLAAISQQQRAGDMKALSRKGI